MTRSMPRALASRLLLAAALAAFANASPALWAQGTPQPAAEAADEQPLPDEPKADAQPTPAVPPGSTAPTSPSSSPMPPTAVAGMISIFMAFYAIFFGLAILMGVGGLVLSCLAIYDCARRDFPDPNTRAMWCLVIAFTRLIGAVIYYFVIYRKGDPPIQRAYVPGTPPPSPMSG